MYCGPRQEIHRHLIVFLGPYIQVDHSTAAATVSLSIESSEWTRVFMDNILRLRTLRLPNARPDQISTLRPMNFVNISPSLSRLFLVVYRTRSSSGPAFSLVVFLDQPDTDTSSSGVAQTTFKAPASGFSYKHGAIRRISNQPSSMHHPVGIYIEYISVVITATLWGLTCVQTCVSHSMYTVHCTDSDLYASGHPVSSILFSELRVLGRTISTERQCSHHRRDHLLLKLLVSC